MSLLLVLALACTRTDGVDSGDLPPAPDLTERLPSGEARAGFVVDEASLFAGISAEGRVGDVLIYNDRVRFVVQGPRPGSFYMEAAGQVIDADIVRPEGELGRDAVEDWFGMHGLGHLLMGETLTVVSDGSDGSAARLRVEGTEGVMAFINGVLEGDLIRPLDVAITQEFVLAPDSPLLEVSTTITADDEVTFQPMDLLLGAQERMESWYPSTGLDGPPKEARGWTGYVARANDLAYGMFPAPGGAQIESSADLIAEYASGTLSAESKVTLAPGESWTYRRFYGVGPDLATLSNAWQALDGADIETVSGTVTTASGPVAGARVTVLVDDSPFTLAVTAPDGSWSADVPAGSVTTWLADGRGPDKWVDLPAGATPFSTYAADAVKAQVLASLGDGTPAPTAPRAHGVASADDPLLLIEPSTLSVRGSAGEPLSVVLSPLNPPAAPDPRVARSLRAQRFWTADGSFDVDVEPGSYRLHAHRGTRYEVFESEITLVSGETAQIDIALDLAYEAPGYLVGDPHIHASPSQDGEVSMEDRLIVAAAMGLQLHFGTDHDHVADYRPLIAALGLQDHLNTVVATEMSPVIRGHMNLYPLEPRSELANNGSFPWWQNVPDTTDAQMQAVREHYTTDYLVQSNHTLSAGLASSADWSPGKIDDPDKWTTDVQAMEVNNAGNTSTLAVWEDLTNRGWRICPTSVSDSHSHDSGGFGLNTTFIGIGSSSPSDYTDAGLISSMMALDVVASRGPFIDSELQPGSTVSAGSSWTVTALSPSWIVVDRLELWRDATLVETVEGTTATFDLSPDKDAWYTVQAKGDTGMAPVWGNRTPWAMTAPVFVDVGGDGWNAPLPALVLAD